ncbi:MAG: DUF2520 domain-containing protein [Prevotella sp.]|nr:DUF2520 domain-containing protein [Prevotella sp.]
MRIVFIGAGRLASNLAPALHEAGHQIVQVYSRTQAAAELLAAKVDAQAVDSLTQVVTDADVFVLSVTDTVLPSLIAVLGEGRDKSVFLHTAGSVPMDVFSAHSCHYGVLYPMQTFSKERRVDLRNVPFFIEGNDDQSLQVAQQLAGSVSKNCRELSSDARRHLHLAAVFACNFANHCYQLSAEVLAQYGIPFDVMLPLIDETAAKVHELSPVQAQTGPAVRYDEGVMNAQLQLLASQPLLAQVYQLMSQSIHHSQQEFHHHD